MTVNLGTIEIGPDELRALGLALSGRNRDAKRAEVKTWALSLIGKQLAKADPTKNGSTEMRTMACPKCGKPIAVSVPCAGKSAPALDVKALQAACKAAAATLTKLAEVQV